MISEELFNRMKRIKNKLIYACMYISIKLHLQNVYSLIFYIGYLKIRYLTRDSLTNFLAN